MSIWIEKDTRLLVQGLTGREGTFHALASREYGTRVVAGVTPGKGGVTHEGIPVFNTVAQAVAATGADASMIFVPPSFAADAIVEAADAGVGVIACITEGIPTNDMIRVRTFLSALTAAVEKLLDGEHQRVLAREHRGRNWNDHLGERRVLVIEPEAAQNSIVESDGEKGPSAVQRLRVPDEQVQRAARQKPPARG